MRDGDSPEAVLLGDTLRIVQGRITQRGRIEFATALARAMVRHTSAPPQPTPDGDLLRRDGLLRLGRPLTTGEADRCVAHFSARPCYSGHIAARSTDPPAPLDHWLGRAPQASHALADVVTSPHLLELALDDRVLGIAASYLGCWPTLYSMNAFWSLPNHAPTPGLQTWHRDYDDFRFCTLFVLLSDTTPADGGHGFVTGSHEAGPAHERLVAAVERHARRHPEARSLLEREEGLFAPVSSPHLDGLLATEHADAVASVSGPRGSAFLEDTYGLHCGSRPSAPRLLFWARYGLYRNFAHVANRDQPIDPRLIEGRVDMTERRRCALRLLAPTRPTSSSHATSRPACPMPGHASSEARLLGDALRLIQSDSNQRARVELAGTLAHAASRRAGGTPAPTPQGDILRRDGLLPVGRLLAPEQADASVAFLSTRACYSGNTAATSADPPAPLDHWLGRVPQVCHALADIADAPHLWEVALDERVLAVVGSYLGCWPTIYSMNASWSLPERAPPPGRQTSGAQTWRRDYDDFRFCRLLILLSDTTPADGGHCYVTGSHEAGPAHGRLMAAVERYVANNPEARAAFDRADGLFSSGDNPHLDRLLATDHADAVTSLHGSRGTAFIEDTYGLHRSAPPAAPRLLFQIRYGLYRNTAHVDDRITPIDRRAVDGRVEMTEARRFALRLMVR